MPAYLLRFPRGWPCTQNSRVSVPKIHPLSGFLDFETLLFGYLVPQSLRFADSYSRHISTESPTAYGATRLARYKATTVITVWALSSTPPPPHIPKCAKVTYSMTYSPSAQELKTRTQTILPSLFTYKNNIHNTTKVMRIIVHEYREHLHDSDNIWGFPKIRGP